MGGATKRLDLEPIRARYAARVGRKLTEMNRAGEAHGDVHALLIEVRAQREENAKWARLLDDITDDPDVVDVLRHQIARVESIHRYWGAQQSILPGEAVDIVGAIVKQLGLALGVTSRDVAS